MKKKFSRALALLCALALCVCLAACGGSSDTTKETEYGSLVGEAPSADMAAPEESYSSAAAAEGGFDAGTLLPTDGRKIILNANLTIEALDFEATCSALLKAAQSAGGYVSSTDLYTPSYEGAQRSAHYQLRIPAQNYNAFLESAGKAGNLINKNESTQDVTSEYVDVEARLKSLKLQEERLYAMMEQAGELETLLAIQNQLTEVQYQIESYTARQRTYDELIAYSTVDVDVTEVRQITVKAETFGERIAKAFSGSWSRFGRGAQDFAVWFVDSLPALLVWAVILLAAFFIIRALARKNAARRAARPAAPYKPAEYTVPAAPDAPAESESAPREPKYK